MTLKILSILTVIGIETIFDNSRVISTLMKRYSHVSQFLICMVPVSSLINLRLLKRRYL